MRLPITLLIALAGSLAVHPARAADDPRIDALRAADDERVAAIIAADRDRLAEIFSGDLRYAHSTGAVDNKASYIDLIASGRTKYLVYDYEERNFSFPAPDIALMSGRAHIKTTTAGTVSDGILSFLAVWREEKGRWRFLAWQSCKLPPPAPAAAK
jgi:ketosteroid isomerase-like protein